MNSNAQLLKILMLFAGIGALAGCGDGGLPTVPVSGTVTFDGTAPPAKGTISFTPVEAVEGLPRRPAVASFDAQGHFTVTSFQPGDGLLPGTYLARVNCERNVGQVFDRRNAANDPSYIANSYEPEQLVVEMGSDPIEVNYDVPLKK